MSCPPTTERPLAGIRVLEFGQFIAGAFAGTILAYFGADVIKVEAPGTGDALRQWRLVHDGVSLWWRSIARNKRCITLNLRAEEGRKVAHDLANCADVLVENFRPGVMEQWGLGPDVLRSSNPRLIYTRVSGYGQTGPYADRPGFASVCEAMGGFRYLNGWPGGPPVRPNLSLGDTLAGLHAALGVLLALVHRANHSDSGQVVDVAICEAVFNVLEAVVPEYAATGLVRQPSGSTITGVAPTNVYRCRDSKYVVIGGNTDAIFNRLMRLVGRDDLAEDPRLADNPGRAEHAQEIDDALSRWAAAIESQDILNLLHKAQIPAGPVYSVDQMFADPHFSARGLFERIDINGRSLTLPAIPPMLSLTPGRTEWAGPEIGAHNKEVYGGLLGLSVEEITCLGERGVI